MIRFDHVDNGAIRDLSFDLGQGVTAKVLFDSEDKKNDFFAILTGLRPPQAGRVLLLGEDVYALREKERLQLFQRIGVVPANGGMISNLKAWENLLLPIWYHRNVTAPEAEREVVRLFRQLDLDDAGLRKRMGQLPDQLTLYEKRAVALVRTMLMEPDILIYDFVFTGLDREATRRFMKLTEEYHDKKSGRVSMHLCPEDAVSERLSADHTINLAH